MEEAGVSNVAGLAEEQLKLSQNTMVFIARYTEKAVERSIRGGMTKEEWEHARSDAVEALQGILLDNPALFDYSARMEAVAASKRKR